MIGELFDLNGFAGAVGGIYIFIGISGSLCNMATLLMITCYRMYRLSAYTIMANLALADAVMLIIAGLVCGLNIVQVPFLNDNNATNNSTELLNSNKSILDPKFSEIFGHDSANPINHPQTLKMNEDQNGLYSVNRSRQFNTILEDLHFSTFLLSFLEIAAWTAGIISYALLGINRCVAICFYRTRAKAINRVSFALLGSTITWLIGIITAYIGTMPVPLMGMRVDMWTVSFLSTAGKRPAVFMALTSSFNFASILAQWSCSLMVLMKIHKVRHKINCNKLNVGSAKRFKKQARLTFQFFYPSVICTISSIIFFAKPFMTDILTSWQFIFLHLVWLCNHMCNPFIYAYFNERMRLTYGEWLTCAPLRKRIGKFEKQYSRKHGEPLRISKRLNAAASVTRNSYWRGRSNRSDNFVRSSLQMQSRDFEQFCEVMMSVNTANESSEGWTESSSDTEAEPITAAICASPQASPQRNNNIHTGKGLELHSLVFDLGRRTVEHWANFAKKASL
uniref:7TM_GPCR_Srx domain-containing protein n=1 Tax=Elaeophora elaphi TaxID=1147741 RepID=A0A0R3S3H2_9BILA